VEPFLPVPGHDEEGVVDPDGEPDHRDHVLHEEREVDHEACQGRGPHRDHDREGREDERDEARDHGAEDDEQHDQRHDRTDALALRDVFLDDLVELVEERRRTCHVGLEALRTLHRGDGFIEELGVVAERILIGLRHEDRHQCGATALRHRAVLGEVAAHARHDIGSEGLHLVLEGPDVRREGGILDVRGLRDHEDQFRVGLLAPEALLDETSGLFGFGLVREVDRIRQRVTEQPACDEADRSPEHQDPDDDGPPRVATAGPSE
jgi:hypothetical protein